MRDSVGSTNTELARTAANGAAGGAILAAEAQHEGRGRAARSWSSPARAGLAASMLLRPDVPQSRWSWLPHLTGLAVVEAVEALVDVEVALKWPNDVLLGPQRRKGAGILAEIAGGGVVMGVGVNVSLREEELPREDASSLALEGGDVDRTELLAAFLEAFERRYRAWRDAAGDPSDSGLAAAYAARCHTLGRHVTAWIPDGRQVAGLAERLDSDGRLCISGRNGHTVVAAGDIEHVR